MKMMHEAFTGRLYTTVCNLSRGLTECYSFYTGIPEPASGMSKYESPTLFSYIDELINISAKGDSREDESIVSIFLTT